MLTFGAAQKRGALRFPFIRQPSGSGASDSNKESKAPQKKSSGNQPGLGTVSLGLAVDTAFYLVLERRDHQAEEAAQAKSWRLESACCSER